MAERLYRRYTNRKLYDLADTRYVNLGEIVSHVRAGDDVSVADHPTGADMTGYVLAMAVADEQKTSPEPLIRKLLLEMLRSSTRKEVSTVTPDIEPKAVIRNP